MANKMTVQRAQQQVMHVAGLLRTIELPIDASQLEEAVGVLTAADREAGRREPHPERLRSYESTVMRIAGNIASGLARDISESAAWRGYPQRLARVSVEIARAIVAEVLRTEVNQEETK